jgi:hypothetical protein
MSSATIERVFAAVVWSQMPGAFWNSLLKLWWSVEHSDPQGSAVISTT